VTSEDDSQNNREGSKESFLRVGYAHGVYAGGRGDMERSSKTGDEN